MKKTSYLLMVVILLVASAFTFIQGRVWEIETNFAVKFSGKYANGVFKTLKGNIKFDEINLSESSFDIIVDVASINTGNGLKNKHAKSAKWFDADKYPVIRFVSSSVTKAGGVYQANGQLEMHGVKKDIAIPFTFNKGAGSGTFNSKFKVNRADFGIGQRKGNDDDFTEIDITVPVSSNKF